MNIEFITDADYEPVHNEEALQEFTKPIGPTFQCGSLTLVKNCPHSGCICHSINEDRQIQTTLDY